VEAGREVVGRTARIGGAWRGGAWLGNAGQGEAGIFLFLGRKLQYFRTLNITYDCRDVIAPAL
jgi:hypothetical protein